MRKDLFRVLFAFVFLNLYFTAFSQEITIETNDPARMLDSLRKMGLLFEEKSTRSEVSLDREQAIEYLQKQMDQKYWVNPDDPLRKSFDRLIFEASHEHFDFVNSYLRKYPYDSIMVPWNKFYIWKPVTIRKTGDSGKIPVRADSINLETPVINADTKDTTILVLNADTKDTTILVRSDTLKLIQEDFPGFPFRSYNNPYQRDSIFAAVNSLLNYVDDRDSVVIGFTGIGRGTVPVVLNSRQTGSMRRYWLKNEFSDSVTVWIGNEGRNTIGLYLEQGVYFRKPLRQENYSEAKLDIRKVDRSKLEKNNIILKKHYWDYKTESSVVFSQSALSNWVKGGENSVSTALDITGYADYKRPELKLSSSNFARLKLGFLASGDEAIRKNLDLLETNSKLNHKAFGKFDFSAIMLFKTQVAIGKQYSKVKDPLSGENKEVATMVSRFMNPATLTLGIGLDYKPDKETSINFSPLSYKGTFVPAAGKISADSLIPGKIDQTRYGVAIGRKSKNEPGASFMISKVNHPFKNLTMTNRLQLFTNYINNPQNIDLDWEMIAVMNLNWFTDLRLNTHLIFDDDTKTTVMGKDDKPVMLEDGITQKKSARVQFKEMFGVSLVFRF
ncbi:MAG TPA: DUF3078 domain-containing protein [Bacteroidales bacterium]|nr:DUF3078 domain-containing protein [Bacteroidales bacterium]